MDNFIKSYKDFIFESVSTQGKEKCNIFVGRFQPFHLGHLSVAEQLYKKNKLKTVILSVISQSRKNLHFSDELMKEVIDSCIKSYKYLGDYRVITSSVAIDKAVLPLLRPDYEPVLFGAGTDRSKMYQSQIDTIRKKGNHENILDEFEVYELKREGGFIEDISATKVRQSLIDDDEKTFKSMTPKETHKFYKELRNEITK